MFRFSILLLLGLLFAAAGVSRAQQVSVVNVPLNNASFGTGASINRTSAPEKIIASTVYRFVLSGKVHGTGLLAQAVPNGTDLEDLITQFGGDESALQGTVDNPSGNLPFTFINQVFDQTVGSGLTSAKVKAKMSGKIAADGTVSFTVTDVSIEAAGFPLTDKIVFESGSNLFVGVPPRVQFGVASVTVNEADGNAVISVQRTENLTGAVHVNYATANDSAVAGTDYTTTSGTLAIGADLGSGDITVPILQTALQDGDRSFTITLSNAQDGALLGTQVTIIVNIIDDDVAGDVPRIIFAAASFVGGEEDPTVEVTLTRTGDTTAEATVNFATVDDTAVAGTHYTATSGTAIFEAGQATAKVVVELKDDAVKNASRIFKVTINTPSAGSVLGSLRTTKVIIADDEISSFLPFKGLYTGLIAADPFAYDTAGSARVTVLSTGKFTAQVKFGGKVHKLSGTFDTGGRVEAPFSRTSDYALKLRISTRTPGTITADVTLSDVPIAKLIAKQAYYSATRLHPRPGRYTVLFDPPSPGSGDTPATVPMGHGYGAFVLAKTGTAKFVGKLADGTPIVITGSVAQDGAIPVHLLPYKTGLLYGELFFRATLAPTDVEGTLRWRKKNDRPKDRAYPGGFETTASAAGSLHTRPVVNQRVLNLPTGNIEIGGGNIAEADWFTREFTMNAANFVTIKNPGTEKLRLVLNPVTGAITGRFIPPGGKAPRAFVGVLLRKQNRAAGLFLGAPPKGTPVESGWVEVGP